MSFNPDLTKEAQEVVFSRKMKKLYNPQLSFNNAYVIRQTGSLKNLGLILEDTQLNSEEHFKTVFKKVTKLWD